MENIKKTGNNKPASAVDKDSRSERIKRKAAAAATNESSVAAELKNREHGSEQPAR